MARIDPMDRDALPEYAAYFDMIEERAGYLPNSFLTLGRLPGVLSAWMAFSSALQQLDGVEPGLKVLMTHLSSSASGCRFCEAHTGHTAHLHGVADDKVAAIWEFETSELFTPAERAALRLARDMAQQPNAVTDEHFDELREHFDDEQILELVAAVASFGFWNRWNDTLATDLERPVYEVASVLLDGREWEPGKHGTGV